MNGRFKFILLIFSFLFWSLRIAYWNVTSEAPFSDILDYVKLGQQVADSFSFESSQFWQTYKPPGMPLFLGFVFSVFGSENLIWVRIVQTLVLYFSVIFLLIELKKINTNLFIVGLFALTLAIAKSSIFWSYKASTESLSEALIYLNCAIGLCFLRNPRNLVAIVLGCLLIYSTFVRPQALLVIPFYGLYIMLMMWGNKRDLVKKGSIIVLGMCLVWFPWGLRNYLKYDGVVLFSTQGPYSFLWELGNVRGPSVEESGKIVETNVTQLQIEAPQKFDNDYQAMMYASQISKRWLLNNLSEYPKIVLERLLRTVQSGEEYLTKVSRSSLFESSVLSDLLFDKSPVRVCLGILGILLATFMISSKWLILLVVPLSQWFMGTLFLGYARVLDPSLPIILAGNSVVIYYFYQSVLSRYRRFYGKN